MNRTTKSIFAMLIAVAMIFTALPMSAFAHETEQNEENITVATPATTSAPIAQEAETLAVTSAPIAPATAITGVGYAAQFRRKGNMPNGEWGLYQGGVSDTEVPGKGDTWDVSTDENGTPILTLSGFEFETEATNGMYFSQSAVIALADDTSNSITSTANSAFVSYGITTYNGVDLAITGSTGSLTVTGGNATTGDVSSYGIGGANVLTIKGGKVTAIGGTGKSSNGAFITALNVTGGTFNAIAGTARDANSSMGLSTINTTVSGQGKITAKGNDSAIGGINEPTAASAKGTADGSTTGLQNATWTTSTYTIGGATAKYMELGVADDPDANALKLALEAAGATTVTVSGTTVTFSGGTATITGNSSTAPELTIPAGITLEIDGGTLNIQTSGREGVRNEGTLTLTNGTLKVANTEYYGLWNRGTLNIDGGTVNIENTDGVGITNEPTASAVSVINITGGTVNIKNSDVGGIIGINNNSASASARGELNISGTANINIANTSGNGIFNRGDMAISGGSIAVKNSARTGIGNNAHFADYLCGEITMSGGTLTVANTGGKGISVPADSGYGPAIFTISGGTIQGSGSTGNIELGAASKVTAPSGTFNDRGVTVTATGEIMVSHTTAAPNANRLTAGTYAWDGTSFKRTNSGASGPDTDPDTDPDSTPTTTPTTSGNTSSSSNNTPAPSAPVITPMDNKATGTLNIAINAAVNAASSNGASLDVRLKNVSNLTKENAAAILAKAKGKKATVSSDVMSENGRYVEVRVTLDPALITKTVRLDGYIRESQTVLSENRFKKHFANKIMVVSLGQDGKFGQAAKIAAKLDSNKFDSTNNLYFYSYDKNTNKYTRITEPKYRIDKNGYLHFYTGLGGDIVISENPLEKL